MAGYSGSGRSSVVWQAVHTHVRTSALRAPSRLSVHGISFLAPQRGQVSVGWPGCTSLGSQGIFGFTPGIIR